MSSPNTATDDQFTPFDVSKAEQVEPPVSEPLDFSPKSDSHFEVPEWYWESLRKDPVLRQELDSLVDKKARAMVESKMEEYRKEAETNGYQDGLQKAIAATELKLKELTEKANLERSAWQEDAEKKLSLVTEQLLAEKQSLLCDHESRWAKALLHLLQGFHVGRAHDFTYEIREWVEASMREFKVKGKIRISVPRSEFQKYKDALTRESAAISNRWELHSDDELKEGQIRCDSNEGGVFFCWEAQEKELERLVSKINSTDTSHAA